MLGQQYWADYGDFRLVVESQEREWLARVYDRKNHVWMFELSVNNPEAGKAIAWQGTKRILELPYYTHEPTWNLKKD
jgi:hypothetical protein